MHQRPVPMGFREIWVQCCSVGVAGDCLLKLLHFLLRITEIAVSHRKIRLREDGLCVDRDRVIEPAKLLEQVAQVAISGCETWPQPCCLLQAHERCVRLPTVLQRIPQRKKRFCKVRLEGYGLPEASQCLVRLLTLL